MWRCMVVECWIAWVAWCSLLLGLVQSRIPIWNRLKIIGLLTWLWLTLQSHSAPWIMFTQSRLLKKRLGYMSLHHRLWMTVSSSGSPVFLILWKVSWVICQSPSVFLSRRNKGGNYLISQRVVTKAWQWGMFPPIPTTDTPKEPTGG